MNYKELFKDNTYLLEEPEVKSLIKFCEYWEKKFKVAGSYISKNGDIEYVKYLHYESKALLELSDKEITNPSLPTTCIKEWESADYCGEKNKCSKCVTKTK